MSIASKELSPAKTDIKILCNVIIEVAAYHLWCILLVRSKSKVNSILKKEGVTQGQEYQEVD